jgi:DnaJ-class molecular chaperone
MIPLICPAMAAAMPKPAWKVCQNCDGTGLGQLFSADLTERARMFLPGSCPVCGGCGKVPELPGK